MSRATTKRANAVDREITAVLKDSTRALSSLNVNADLAMQLIPWVHDNILGNKGDVDENDRSELNVTFTEIFVGVQSIMAKLQEIYEIYNDDPAIYQANLDAFIDKYPQSAAALVDLRFN